MKQTHSKQERIVEAVRHGLEGIAAVEFVQKSGYAMSTPGIARNLRMLGGRGRVQALINEGMTNIEVLQTCFPDADLSHLRPEPPTQGELFVGQGEPRAGSFVRLREDTPYETRKMAIKVPADLYEAIRLAAKAEGMSQNDLIVEVLTSALSRIPGPFGDTDHVHGG
ncbi:MAG: hypothetical protein WC655_13060 [Candidatus Hydrogenedentales bacterium]|jgi:hypothetical protein